MTSQTLARLYDFIAGTGIKSAEVDGEFNQLVAGHNTLMADIIALQEWLDVTILPAFAGAGGAAGIGFTPPVGMTAATVQLGIVELLSIAQAAQASTILPGTVTEAMLAFDVATQAELNAFSGAGAGLELFADDVAFSGTKKADGLTWKNQCVYATTAAGSTTVLTEIITNKLKLGSHSIILRMKSANNVITADVVRVEVLKYNGSSYVSQTFKLFKPTVFNVTTDYESLYVPFDYNGGRASSDNVKIIVSLLANATAFEVSLDSITVLPSTIGIVG